RSPSTCTGGLPGRQGCRRILTCGFLTPMAAHDKRTPRAQRVSPMPKSLIICCDGTWNSYDDPSPTNVFKLRGLILPDGPGGVRQSVYYDTGIGTRGAWLERAFDGLTGRGLSDNVRQAYRALIDNYEPGDALYLFGFS